MSVINRYIWGRRCVIALPIIYAVAFVLNTVLCYYGKDTYLLDTLFGLSLGSVIMLYLMHRMFSLCLRHRLMIYYLAVVSVFNLIDDILGIPVTTEQMIAIYVALFGIFSLAYFLTILL